MFPQKFFPGSDPFIATMLSFTTFFVGFVARPIGAAIFGHFGDRVGRKKLLVFTMIVMGASTMAVGLTPSYEVDRRLGSRVPDDRPHPAGARDRRPVERFGADGSRVDRSEATRLHHELRAGRRAGRDGARQRRARADDRRSPPIRRFSTGDGASRFSPASRW